MLKTIILALLGLVMGTIAGFYTTQYETTTPFHTKKPIPKQIIGFLPYWQLDKAKVGEENYLTTLTYFALNVDGDGHIVKLTNEQEEDPGWYQLHSDKLKSFFVYAKNKNVKLSLLISSGDAGAINQLVSNPIEHGKTLVNEVTLIMKQYNFTDLNLDIEDTSVASKTAQMHFTQFVRTVKLQLEKEKLGTLTVEISPTDVIKYNLINVPAITPYTNTIVLMAYDFHSPDSIVTGPIAPLNGAGEDSEYDVTTAVQRSLQSVPPEKLILGMPLYGYEWETLNTAVRSAIIPGSGVLASNNRVESMLSSCTTCNTFYDKKSQETFVVFQDATSGTYHQISFPDKNSVTAKILFSNREHLGGVALWALGYENDAMLTPLTNYKD
jgi:spore germination protein YaaH